MIFVRYNNYYKFKMLDYHGSIILKRRDINDYLFNRYINEANREYIHNLIQELRKKKIIYEEYSVSGWHMFHCYELIKVMNHMIQEKRKKNEQKLKFIYCYSLLYPDNDVGIIIGNKI